MIFNSRNTFNSSSLKFSSLFIAIISFNIFLVYFEMDQPIVFVEIKAILKNEKNFQRVKVRVSVRVRVRVRVRDKILRGKKF